MEPDAIAVVEAAYASASSDAGWLQGLLDALRPILDLGMGVGGFTIGPGSRAPLTILDCAWAGEVPHRQLDRASMAAGLAVPELSALLLRPGVGKLSTRFARKSLDTFEPFAPYWKLGVRDQLGLIVNDGGPYTVGFVASSQAPFVLTRQAKWRLEHLASHIGAGLRMRRQATVDEARISPQGTILHAEGEAKHKSVRAMLRDAAIAVDQARSSLRSRDPEEALALWRGLVDARWSIVDRFESDGRR